MASHYRVKASVLRSYLRYFEQRDLTARVLERVPAGTAALLQRPPLPSSFVEGADMDAIGEAVFALEGGAGLRRMAQLVIDDQLGTVLKSMINGVLRLVGASPVRVRDDDGGAIASTFLPSVAITLEAVLKLAGARGVVSAPRVDDPTAATFDIKW